MKGVPIDITEAEFKEFLDLNKISYAKAERLKSQKDGRVLPIFQLEITNPTEAEALISQNLACDVTEIVSKVEQFRAPISVVHCYNYQSFGHSAKTCRSTQKCLICGENHSHKGCPSRGPHVASYKVCPEYKKQAFRQHVVSNQKSYASVLSQNTLLQSKPTQTFTFTAEQLTEFVANVVIQIAQPQVCYPNSKQDTLDLKSNMCRKVSQAAETFLSLTSLQRICLNQSVLSALLPPSPPPPP